MSGASPAVTGSRTRAKTAGPTGRPGDTVADVAERPNWFGADVAERYDETSAEMHDPALLDATVDLLADLAGKGPALELAVGTGRVALPLARRGLVAGAALAWARALGEFGATLMFAGNLQGRTQTLPLAVYTALESDVRAAQALAVILVVIALAIIIFLRPRRGRHRR